jgi:hypothetical protein
MVPGDGQHVIWPWLVGRNRARYMLLTGKKLAAREALEWGAVAEVLPKNRLLDRAWELAHELALRPPLTLRYTRMLFTQDLKRAFLNELSHGIARETYAQRQFFPVGGGMAPLDRPWDKEPWSDDVGLRNTRSASSRVAPPGLAQRPHGAVQKAASPAGGLSPTTSPARTPTAGGSRRTSNALLPAQRQRGASRPRSAIPGERVELRPGHDPQPAQALSPAGGDSEQQQDARRAASARGAQRPAHGIE